MATERVKIAFLDRDGTINVDTGYVRSTDSVTLLPGAASAIGDLKRAGFVVVVVSNQSVVGRGWATIEDVELVNNKIVDLLLADDADANLDLVLFATDHPKRASDRRKPATGMLRDVEQYWQFDPTASWMIGDRQGDMEFGQNAGLPKEHCLMLLSENDQDEDRASWPHCFATLREAVDSMLGTVSS